jgi:cytochrome oxidase Cu insertion factor (SCO1/SenC/PrrC family)
VEKDPTRKSFRGIALPVLVCLVLGALGGIGTALVTKPSQAQTVRFTPPREELPDFRLRDESGKWRTPADARGEVLVLTFLYSTCHDLCPKQAAEIKDAVVAAGGGVQVYGVSVDPVGDTQERVRSWLKRFGLLGGPVHFLRGSREELRPVWAQFGIVPIGATEAEAKASAESSDRYYQSEASGSGGSSDSDDKEEEDAAVVRAAPDAAHDPYPDVDDQRYRGHARHEAGLDFEHSAYVMVIDKRGRTRVGFSYELLNTDLLLRDLQSLKAEA